MPEFYFIGCIVIYDFLSCEFPCFWLLQNSVGHDQPSRELHSKLHTILKQIFYIHDTVFKEYKSIEVYRVPKDIHAN